MSKTKALIVILPEEKPEQVEKLLAGFIGMEEIHGRSRLLYQAAQGACLVKLQQQYGFTAGGDRKSGEAIKTASCGFDSWAEFVEDKFGFTDDSARRRMQVWQGMVPRLAKLSPHEQGQFRHFLTRPQLHLTESEAGVLRKLTDKITDQDTQIGFLRECGFIKKPAHHHLPKGGRDNGSVEPKPKSEAELVQEDFYDSFTNLIEFGEQTVKRGKDDISKLALIPKDRWMTHRADLQALIAKGDALHGIKEGK